CYRLLGHNEGDEPTFTQPKLYHAIAKHKNVGELYAARLISLQRVTMAEVAAQKTQVQQRLEKEFSTKEDQTLAKAEEFQGIWAGYRGGAMNHAPDLSTGVDRQRLTDLLIAQTRWPENFRPHPKIVKAVSARREMAQGNRPLDWSAAESLAWATLATEGVSIRLSGQDSARGTFSHRHAVLHDYENGAEYIPLQHLAADQARVEIYNSPLSEAGVLGFEYGYSLDSPAGLTMWEAQFGDFVNAAQVIVDQFITAAEEKWRRLSGIVLLLPHGFEGMGPEHSSARLERFLQLCAKDNIQVVNPTTPAQYFHCLRRQALSRWRKPLVIMTPKSLLRHPRSVSSLEEHCAAAQFRPVIEPINETASRPIDRVVLCSGKIFFDLEKRRQELTADQVPIIRIEQLYPFPKEQLKAALARYPAGTPLLWVQEEPENMGAWWYLNDLFKAQLPDRTITVVARAATASPATGSATRHKQQQNELIDQVFGPA
ncbi:MAG: thiamine pyrophosphate-dependent enzyme, partial [Candidatus Binatia bacterium]